MANTQLAINMLLGFLIVVTGFLLAANNNAYLMTTFLAGALFLYDTVRAKQTPGMALNTLVGSPSVSRLQNVLLSASTKQVCLPNGTCVRIDDKTENLEVSDGSSSFAGCTGSFLSKANAVTVVNGTFWASGTSLGLSEVRYSNDGFTWFTY